MGNVNASSGSNPLVNAQQAQKAAQPAANDRQTLTEKFFEETEVGGFYKDAPVLSGVATTVGGLGVVGLGVKYEPIADLLFNQTTAGLLVGGAGGLLIEEGVDDLQQGRKMSGAIKSTLGGVAALGSVELLTGGKISALSTPFDIVTRNGYATGGAAMATGAAFLAKSGVEDIQEGETLKGGLKTAAGVVGGLGATELIGRQFGNSLIVDPLVRFAKTGGAQTAGAALGGVAAAGLAVDGVQRLAENGDVLNDALGVAEVAGGALLATGSTTLAGMALGNQAMTSVLGKSAKNIGGGALAGTAYVLGKETINNFSENGLTYMNAATGTGAALAALGAAETFGLNAAFTKGGQWAGAAGLGAASGLMAMSAYESIQDGQYGEGALKGAGAVIGAGGAMALANVPGVRDVGEAILKHATDDVLAPVAEFAVKNPLVSIPLAAGGAYAAYKLMDKGGDDAPTVEQVQAIGEQVKQEQAAAKVEE